LSQHLLEQETKEIRALLALKEQLAHQAHKVQQELALKELLVHLAPKELLARKDQALDLQEHKVLLALKVQLDLLDRLVFQEKVEI
jgi:hypothetical protein